MTEKQLNEVVAKRLEECKEILSSAGAEYSDSQNDRLSNFKCIAEFIHRATGKTHVEITPQLVWLIYYLKHVVTLTKAATGQTLTREPLGSRVNDAINYPLLLEALDVDQNPARAFGLELDEDEPVIVTCADQGTKTSDVLEDREPLTAAEPSIAAKFAERLGIKRAS